MIAVELRRYTRDDLRKIYAKLVGDSINNADRNIFSVFLIAAVYFRIDGQLGGQLLNRVVADLAQLAESCRNFVKIIGQSRVPPYVDLRIIIA